MDIVYQKLAYLLPPAFLLAAIAYLVRFFGKVITDQKPFSDERNWEIEISGIKFFINLVLFYGILGSIMALHCGNFGLGPWSMFIITSICVGWLWFIGGLLVERVYKIKFPFLRLFVMGSKNMQEDSEKLKEYILRVSRFIPLSFFSIIFSYALTISYQTNNPGWIAIIAINIFLGFFFMALVYSLYDLRLPQVDISFTDGKDTIYDSTLLKVNDTNIRLKKDGQVIIVNWSQVKKIDYFPAKNDSDLS